MTCADIIKWLEDNASAKTLAGMARYGIEARHALGITIGQLLTLKKRLGKSHDLSLDLWATGIYEARLLASMVGEPDKVTPEQMDAWASSFENWADCDTVCFNLFDRTPARWGKVHEWAIVDATYVKRAGFALMACLVAHDKTATEAQYLALLPLIEAGAVDDRPIVGKGVSWALRTVGKATQARNAGAIEVARRLSMLTHPVARSVGKEALRELTSAKVQTKLKPSKTV